MGLREDIDREVGLDTEQARVNFLKYISYGRQLEKAEAVGGVDQVSVKLGAIEALDAVDAALEQIRQKQIAVEKVEEDDAWLVLKAKAESPEGLALADLLAGVEGILGNVDRMHSELMAERKALLDAIRAKYA